MKRVPTLVLIAGLLAVGAVAPWLAQAEPRDESRGADPVSTSAPGSRCKVDVDCVLVPDDCCACSEGGSQRALAKKDRAAHEKARTKRCAGTMCAQMMSQHPSCSQIAVCRAGLCALAAATNP